MLSLQLDAHFMYVSYIRGHPQQSVNADNMKRVHLSAECTVACRPMNGALLHVTRQYIICFV